MGTSDYFNRCNNGVVGVPQNFWGYQEPYDGDGYIGMSLISWYINSTNYTGNEYIQTKLVEQLKPCVEYQFEMKINFANYSRYAFSRIGALFSETELQLATWDPLLQIPQVLNSQGFLSDTINWITISGSFIASGLEKYLTIGYFYDNVQNDTLNFQTPIGFDEEGYGYYLVDMVSLIETSLIENCLHDVPNVFTPNSDGNNDTWEFFPSIEGEIFILNRWGEEVYHSIGKSFIWNGNNCTDGVYYYKFITPQSVKTGFIQLVR